MVRPRAMYENRQEAIKNRSAKAKFLKFVNQKYYTKIRRKQAKKGKNNQSGKGV
jgi:hypothetical protein